MMTPFNATLIPLSDTAVKVPVANFSLSELRNVGWLGIGRIDPGVLQAISPSLAMRTAFDMKLVPGAATQLELAVTKGTDRTGTDQTGTVIRGWPSVITDVAALPENDGGTTVTYCEIQFCDPLTYLRERRIWGSFQSCTPGMILGGAMSLAMGGRGDPTYTPALAGLPVIRISEYLRESVQEIPYAVAVGETLGGWIGRVFGRLGIRIEILGDADGICSITLRDSAPSASGGNGGHPALPMEATTVDAAPYPTASDLVIHSLRLGATRSQRDVLLDNPESGDSARIGVAGGAVEGVVSAAGTNRDEAALRSTFPHNRAYLAAQKITAISAQPSMFPGRVVTLTDQDVLFTNEWQVASTLHAYESGGHYYYNAVELEMGGIAWRPPVPADDSPRVISGTVDDGVSETGQPVARDRLGRISVRLACSFAGSGESGQGETETNPNGNGQAQSGAPGVQTAAIPLPVIKPMAGDIHGFVGAHRQGDLCRVILITPLYAEIHGFSFRADRTLSTAVFDASTGFVLRQGSEEWRGMLFRADESIKDYEEIGYEAPILVMGDDEEDEDVEPEGREEGADQVEGEPT